MTNTTRNRIAMMIYSFGLAIFVAAIGLLVFPEVNKLLIITPVLAVYGYALGRTFFKKANIEINEQEKRSKDLNEDGTPKGE